MRPTVLVCVNRRPAQPCCAAKGSEKIVARLEERAAERGLEVDVDRSICFGRCQEGPNVKVLGGAFFHEANVDDADAILDAAVDKD